MGKIQSHLLKQLIKFTTANRCGASVPRRQDNTHISTHRNVMEAADKNDCEKLRKLLKHGKCPNITDETGYSPLTYAVRNNCMVCVRILLEYNARVDRDNEGTIAPLTLACEMNHAEICAVLLQHGAKYEYRDCEGYTPLHIAVDASRWDCVEVLLQHGANFRTKTYNGATLLHTLVYILQSEDQEKEIDLMLRLIRMGVDMNAKASYDDVYKGRYVTALELAMIVSNTKAALLLVEAGCDLNCFRLPNGFLTRDAKCRTVFQDTRWRDYIEPKIREVPSLQVLSRNRITTEMGNGLSMSSDNSGLPARLVDFVQFKNLLPCWEMLNLKSDDVAEDHSIGYYVCPVTS